MWKRCLALLSLTITSSALPSARVGFDVVSSLNGAIATEAFGKVHVADAAHGAISPGQLATAVGRSLCLDTPAETGRNLPVGDLFDRPAASVLLFVDGLRQYGTSSTPYLTSALRSSSASDIRLSHGPTGGDDEWGSVLTEVLGVHFVSVMEHAASEGQVVCASPRSTRSRLERTEACGASSSQMIGEEAVPVEEEELFSRHGIRAQRTGDQAWTLSVLPAVSVAEGDQPPLPSGHLTLDRSVPADYALMESLLFLAQLPGLLAPYLKGAGAAQTPPIVIGYLGGAGEYAKNLGGRGGIEADRAFFLLDTAIRRALEAVGLPLAVQLVAGEQLADELPLAYVPMPGRGRVLQGATSTKTSTSQSVTLTEINQYQINLWTAFFLVVAVLMAILGIACMDVGRDSLLFAKFQTDTSGMKND